MGTLLDIDNTKRSAFVACPRKYYWAYVRHLQPFHGSTALRYGSAWHAAMEAVYTEVKEHGWKDLASYIPKVSAAVLKSWEKSNKDQSFFDDYRSIENLSFAFLLWIDAFSNDPGLLEVVNLERKFELPVPGLEDSVVFTGKIDMEIKYGGAPFMNEHKTTGSPLGQAVERLHRSPQMLGYTWAMKQLGVDIDGAMVCLHHLSARKNKDGIWGKPKIEFQRSPQLYTDADLRDWLDSFKYTAERILEAREKMHFPMFHDNCYQFGRCKYTALCEQDFVDFREVNTADFIEREWDVREED